MRLLRVHADIAMIVPMIRAFRFALLSIIVPVVLSLFRSRANLVLENLALRQQLAILKHKHPRPVCGLFDRAFWVVLSRMWPGWSSALVLVIPETVIRWHRAGFRLYWRAISKRRGRPPADVEIRALIRRMARENPTWGAPRIHGELLKLGFDVSERTVSRYLPRRTPDKDKAQRWLAFLRNHRDGIAAMDFFVVPTVTFRLLYVLVIVGHGRRNIIHLNVTEHPTSAWVAQQLREAFPYDAAPRHLVFDRDSIFGTDVVAAVKSFGISPARTSYRSPWQNGVVERWIGSCRRELLDHVIVFGEDHLRRLLRKYVAYYGSDRTHCSLDKDAPATRPIDAKPSPHAQIVAHPRCGGLHHRYEWRDAA